MTQRFHGIALANNSFAENFHFERLAADPSPITYGRIWFNTTDGSFKYSSLASDGAVAVNVFASAADLVASVNSLTANLNSEIAARTAGDAAEIAARIDAINTLTTALNKEIANRTDAVAAEQQARIDGDAAEAAARTAAITVLAGTTSNADATETAARLAGDAVQTTRSNGIQAELDTIEASLGLNTDGTYTAPANTAYLATVTTHKEADVALDTAIHNEVVRATGAETSLASGLANEAQLRTDGDANLQAQLIAYINSAVTNNVNADNAETAARIAADAAIQSELDITQASIGLNTDGTITPVTGTNYIDGIKSVFAGAFILDAQIHTSAVNIANETTARQNADNTQTAALNTEITNRTNAVAGVQAELNTTQAGAGLETDGTYLAATDSNYLNAAVTLKDADHKLDAAVKSVADRTTAIESVSVPALQVQITTEVNRAQTAEALLVQQTTTVNGHPLNANVIVTKSDVGLGNVDNTSDINKPVSTAQANADANTLANAKLYIDLETTRAEAAEASLVPKTTTVNGHALSANINISQSDVGLGNVNNTADIDKPVSTAQANADASTLASAKSYADSLIVGLWDDRGNYDASVNTFPATGGSGSSGAVLRGDIWTISVAGTLGGVAVVPRETVRALIDSPGQIAGNWAIGIANTDIDDSITLGVTGRAPSQNAVAVALANEVTNRDAAIAATSTGVNTGDETADSIKTKLGITTLSGSNTGDETASTIKNKLGISTLSGSNTGDQTLDELGGVPTTTTVNGHPLNANVTITADDIGLGNVLNVAQAAAGLITASGLNVSTNNLLVGRATAGAGAVEEITLGSNLSLSGNVLNVVEGITPNNIYNLNNTLAYAVTSTLTSCGLSIASGQKAIIRSIRVCNVTYIADAITAQINVSGGTNTPIANAIPVNANGSIELVLRPKIMSPGDTLLFKSQSASNGLQVIISYEINTDTTLVNAGYITTTTLGTALTSNGTNATIVESCLLVNTTTYNYGFNIAWVDASNAIQAYLVYGIVVPANSTIEIMQNAFRLPTGHKLQASCDGGSSAVYISGKNI
jgi:hypothetical protein